MVEAPYYFGEICIDAGFITQNELLFVLEHQGKIKVIAINPLRLSYLFNNDELDRACQEMRTLYEEIMEEATL